MVALDFQFKQAKKVRGADGQKVFEGTCVMINEVQVPLGVWCIKKPATLDQIKEELSVMYRRIVQLQGEVRLGE